MSFKNTLEVLHNQAEEILKITEGLKDSDDLRVIDIHLLLDKLRDIYDLAADLQASAPLAKVSAKQVEEKQVVPPEESLPVEVEEPVLEMEDEIEPFANNAQLVHNCRIGREGLSWASMKLAQKEDIPFVFTPPFFNRFRYKYKCYSDSTKN